MTPFLILSIIILLASFIRSNRQEYALILLVVILFLISGFRAETVGTDTSNYRIHFERIAVRGYMSVELGWVLLNKLIIWLGGSYSTFISFISFITIIPLAFLLKRYSANPIQSLFFYFTLYIYFFSFNISRQILASTIILFAIMQLISNRKILFILLILLASLFHTTALIVLPIVFVDKLPNNLLTILVIVFASFIGGIFLTDIISRYLASSVYSGYIDRYEFGNASGNALYLLILNSFFLFIALTIKQRDIYFKIYLCYIIFANILVRVPFGDRVVLNLSIYLTVFFPYFIANNKFKQKSIVYIIMILYAYVMFFRTFGAGEILPYDNVLF